MGYDSFCNDQNSLLTKMILLSISFFLVFFLINCTSIILDFRFSPFLFNTCREHCILSFYSILTSRSPATHDSISFRSFLRTRTKEELRDLSFNKYIDPIIFILSLDLEKKWLYLDGSKDGCVYIFRCSYCATCPFYLEFSKNDKGCMFSLIS